MPYPRHLSVRRRSWLPGVLFHAAWALGCDSAGTPAAGAVDTLPAEATRGAEQRPPEHAPTLAAWPDEPSLDEIRPKSTHDPPDHVHALQPARPPDHPPDHPIHIALEPAAFHGADQEPGGARAQGAGEDDATSGKLGPHKGRFSLTYYWMAQERGRKGAPDTRIYTSRCKPIARVSREFASRLGLEGTGTLRDGRVVNVSGPCDCAHSPCFFVVSDDAKRWGVGVSDRPLSPFRSVAVDPTRVSIGTRLYVPELDGLTMPGVPPWGGFVHDGCVIADDRGGSVTGKQLDFFMVRKPYYQAFHRRHRLRQVTVFDGGERCARVQDDLQPVDRNSI